MNQIIVPNQPDTAIAIVPSARARRFILEAEAPSTRRAYMTDINTFTTWCTARGVSPMPAAPETVANFIADSAEQGLRPSTIGRRVAAIRYLHRLADEETPTRSELVSKTLKGIRREMGGAPDRKAAATADIVERMIDTCDDSLKGLRDRAILALGFAGAFRRSELVALRVEDLSRTDDGYRVLIRKPKTDQEGQGQTIAIPRGNRLRPGPAIEAWMAAAGIESGPLFRRVRRGGKVGAQPLRPAVVAEIVKERCLLINEDPAQFSGHSLRSGFLTSAARAGATIFKMRDVSRHKSLETLNAYVRDADLFRNHAGSAFL